MSVPEVITAAEVKIVKAEQKSLVRRFADRYGVDQDRLLVTLKATAFRGEVSNEQMMALLIVAEAHNLNPWTKELYAFPSRNGIVPVVSVDGWAKLCNDHPQFDGMEFTYDKDAEPREKGLKGSYTCTIHRKDREHPTTITEFMEECFRPTDPWKSHPMRMLRHKSLIQCARLAFSFSGIFDNDEAERIVAAEEIDVTPREDGEMTRGELGEPRRVSPKKLRDTVEGCLAAVAADDGPGLLKIRATVDNEEWLYLWGKMRSYERSGITKLLAEAKAADAGVGLIGWASELIASCVDLKALQVAWGAIGEAYDQNGVDEIPLDLQTLHSDRRAELGK